jgi:hypothetical protein
MWDGVSIRVPIQFFDTPYNWEESRDAPSSLRELRDIGNAVSYRRAPQPYSDVLEGTSGPDLFPVLLSGLTSRVPDRRSIRVVVGPAGIGKSYLYQALFAELYDGFIKDKAEHNFQEGQYWFEVTLRNAPIDFSFIVSIHHVGREVTGIMRALAFAEFEVDPKTGARGTERQERVRRTCSLQPFTITWQSEPTEVRGAFLDWLEEAYAVALRSWLDLF